VCERSSQNGPWRFECSKFKSKNVLYVVHVLVKRSKTLKILFTYFQDYGNSIFYDRFRTKELTIHICRCWRRAHNDACHVHGKLDYIPKKYFPRNFKNPKKFWKSEKNWNSRFQNLGKIDSIILPNRFNRSDRKKSLNRLDRFIGQRIHKFYRANQTVSHFDRSLLGCCGQFRLFDGFWYIFTSESTSKADKFDNLR